MPNMGSWVLRPFGILLLTTNQSESFNCTMKRFGGWKRSPVDLMAISLMRLDKFFQIKIARGHYGLGEYTLKEDFVDIYPKQGVVRWGRYFGVSEGSGFAEFTQSNPRRF